MVTFYSGGFGLIVGFNGDKVGKVVKVVKDNNDIKVLMVLAGW